jgi:hypothetical protein
MPDRHWFTRKEREAYRRRVALEREATRLLHTAARALSRGVQNKSPPESKPASAEAAMPRRLTLSDLPLLRRKRLVP